MGQDTEERAASNAQNEAVQQDQAVQQNTAGETPKPKVALRISSPEQVDDYIRVTTPGMWVLVSAILVLLAALFIWAFAAKLEMKTTQPDGTVTTEYVKPSSFITDGATGTN